MSSGNLPWAPPMRSGPYWALCPGRGVSSSAWLHHAQHPEQHRVWCTQWLSQLSLYCLISHCVGGGADPQTCSFQGAAVWGRMHPGTRMTVTLLQAQRCVCPGSCPTRLWMDPMVGSHSGHMEVQTLLCRTGAQALWSVGTNSPPCTSVCLLLCHHRAVPHGR